jgi:hypothetical protein
MKNTNIYSVPPIITDEHGHMFYGMIASEDASSDVDLHEVVEKMTKLCTEGNVLEMKDYETIVGC